MIDNRPLTHPETFKKLRCPACGNTEDFAEFMSFEAHLVSADLRYRHLLYAEVDHYECFDCSEVIDADPSSEYADECASYS
jgi:hypothetical protein